jgi:hypothetical protein
MFPLPPEFDKLPPDPPWFWPAMAITQLMVYGGGLLYVWWVCRRGKKKSPK